MHKVTDAQIIEALEDTGGMIGLAAVKLGVTYQALNLRLRQQESLRQAYEHVRIVDREQRVQRGEKAIDTLLEANHFGAAELTLSRLGKDRGWGPDKPGSNSNVTISFEVQHIIPEAAELGSVPITGESDAATNQLTDGEDAPAPTPPTCTHHGR